MVKISYIIPITKMELFSKNYFDILNSDKNPDNQYVLLLDSDKQDEINKLEKLEKECVNKNVMYFKCNFASPGSTRNLGKKNAQGDWVVFLDSDDEPSVQEYRNSIEKYSSSTEIIINSFIKKDLISGREKQYIFNINERKNIWTFIQNPGIWRISFKQELIHDIDFINSRMGEDQLFIAQCLLKTTKEIKFTDNAVYKYCIGNPDQLTFHKKALKDIERSINQLFDTLKSDNRNRYSYICQIMLIKMMITLFTRNKKMIIRYLHMLFLTIYSLILEYFKSAKRKINISK